VKWLFSFSPCFCFNFRSLSLFSSLLLCIFVDCVSDRTSLYLYVHPHIHGPQSFSEMVIFPLSFFLILCSQRKSVYVWVYLLVWATPRSGGNIFQSNSDPCWQSVFLVFWGKIWISWLDLCRVLTLWCVVRTFGTAGEWEKKSSSTTTSRNLGFQFSLLMKPNIFPSRGHCCVRICGRATIYLWNRTDGNWGIHFEIIETTD